MLTLSADVSFNYLYFLLYIVNFKAIILQLF